MKEQFHLDEDAWILDDDMGVIRADLTKRNDNDEQEEEKFWRFERHRKVARVKDYVLELLKMIFNEARRQEIEEKEETDSGKGKSTQKAQV